MRLALAIPASLLLVGSALLAGCGGNKDNGGNDGTANTVFNVPPMPSTDDPFITIVRQQTDTPAAMSEETLSIDVTNIVATSPEDTQPQAVTF
jgi:hypothetical protein